MRGSLVYDACDVQRNAWFCEQLVKECAELGICLDVETVSGGSEEAFRDASDLSRSKFCVNRSRNVEVSLFFEHKGAISINNSHTVAVGNDKWATYELCRALGIPVMPTFRIDALESGSTGFEYPLVMKTVSGHGGSEVFWAESREDLEEFALKLDPESLIAQKPVSTLGKDMRAYCIADKVIACVERTSETDFRSNFSLGGKARLCEASAEVVETVRLLHSHLDFDYVGIDFIQDGGRWVLNEIEDAAGARMLYALHASDICALFAQQIKRRLGC